jgi:hypothetical protein
MRISPIYNPASLFHALAAAKDTDPVELRDPEVLRPILDLLTGYHGRLADVATSTPTQDKTYAGTYPWQAARELCQNLRLMVYTGEPLPASSLHVYQLQAREADGEWIDVTDVRGPWHAWLRNHLREILETGWERRDQAAISLRDSWTPGEQQPVVAGTGPRVDATVGGEWHTSGKPA